MAVSEPSDVVVLENAFRPESAEVTEAGTVAYPLLLTGYYASAAQAPSLHLILPDPDTPLQLYEAQNAIQIAQAGGAERYAPESYQKALELLRRAQDDWKRNVPRKTVVKEAREAAENAEDARVISLKFSSESSAWN